MYLCSENFKDMKRYKLEQATKINNKIIEIDNFLSRCNKQKHLQLIIDADGKFGGSIWIDHEDAEQIINTLKDKRDKLEKEFDKL